MAKELQGRCDLAIKRKGERIPKQSAERVRVNVNDWSCLQCQTREKDVRPTAAPRCPDVWNWYQGRTWIITITVQ